MTVKTMSERNIVLNGISIIKRKHKKGEERKISYKRTIKEIHKVIKKEMKRFRKPMDEQIIRVFRAHWYFYNTKQKIFTVNMDLSFWKEYIENVVNQSWFDNGKCFIKHHLK